MQLSNKQKEYWNNATHRWNIKEGATRSGKTYLDFFMIPRRIRACSNTGIIVLIGNTKNTLERNIFEPMRNLYGDKLVGDVSSNNTIQLFGRKCHALGAEKINMISKIQGAGIEYCYGDEVTTWHEGVFSMLKSRLDKPNSCFDGTCNPEGPNHWLKAFLDSDADIYRQTYCIDDNPFLSPTFVEQLKKEYAGSVYYDRFILGKWIPAEGVIYRLFANTPENFIAEDVDASSVAYATIGVDFGGNKSAHAFACNGFTRDMRQVITLDEFYLKKEISPSELEACFVDFVQRNKAKYPIYEAYCDSAESTLIKGLESAVIRHSLGITVKKAIKGEIRNRIRFFNVIMARGCYKILRHCTHTIDALKNALWDSKALVDTRLDDGKMNVDSLDALEYATEAQMKNILMIGGI